LFSRQRIHVICLTKGTCASCNQSTKKWTHTSGVFSDESFKYSHRRCAAALSWMRAPTEKRSTHSYILDVIVKRYGVFPPDVEIVHVARRRHVLRSRGGYRKKEAAKRQWQKNRGHFRFRSGKSLTSGENTQWRDKRWVKICVHGDLQTGLGEKVSELWWIRIFVRRPVFK